MCLGVAVACELVSVAIACKLWMLAGSGSLRPDVAQDVRAFLFEITPVLGFIGLGSVVTAVVFLVWLHGAYKDVAKTTQQALRHTPGWAVGSFFIPILGLWAPRQVVQELHDASDPDRFEPTAKPVERVSTGYRDDPLVEAAPEVWQREARVALWWWLWTGPLLLSPVINNVSIQQGNWAMMAVASLLSSISRIAAGVFCIQVVRTITARIIEQRRRSRR
jgi:hypothetical protein